MIDADLKCDLTVIILTLNEAVHIGRNIKSSYQVAKRVVVIDSGSNDKTQEIAKSMGADVFENSFISHANQLNWALDHVGVTTKWVMKLDADEYLMPELIAQMPMVLAQAPDSIDGFTINLRRVFMGKWLRFGALYPIPLLRIWRFGKGRCEERLMDEHLVVQGAVGHINADFVDENLNTLTWWTDKHNKYACREAIELLNLRYHFIARDSALHQSGCRSARLKRWVKEAVYFRLPSGFRAFAYFLYRYVIRLGFLDGRAGFTFHFLQGFWYRYLVDMKIDEVVRHVNRYNVSFQDAIKIILGIDLNDIRKS